MNDFHLKFHPDKLDGSLHVGLIPDGGRRWAKKNNVSLNKSYSITRDLVLEFTKYFFSVGVNEVSVYLSSAQNFRRTDEEIGSFTDVASNAISNEIINLANLLHFKVNIIGDKSSLPLDLILFLQENNNKVGDNCAGNMNLCISYNPIEELSNAIRMSKGENDFLDYLWVKKPLDLVIRSGGANLTSNFLPLQSGFARLYFLDELFNDVSMASIKKIMESFLNLDRKFGE
ncbi:MAG: undecaprenyl diphosphate synthase family protein [Bacteroidota bacterium]